MPPRATNQESHHAPVQIFGGVLESTIDKMTDRFKAKSGNLEVDVAIIGAGSAGLSAMREVKKWTDRFVIVDHGPIGTTCARTGCMPSKIFIQIANEVATVRRLIELGITSDQPNPSPGVDQKQEQKQEQQRLAARSRTIMERVRLLRDQFVASASKSVIENRDHFIFGTAEFVEPTYLRVGEEFIRARQVIIATGSSPNLSPTWPKLSAKILTTESFFELAELPSSMAVIGSGPLGLELGQALSRLGVEVACFTDKPGLAGLTDPEVLKSAEKTLKHEFKIYTGGEAKIREQASQLLVESDGGSMMADLVLASIGRKPNLDCLGLNNIGIKTNEIGLIEHDKETMQIPGFPIFIAGDFAGDRPVLHEAVYEAHMAGFNARSAPVQFRRQTRLSIAFTSPGIAVVGKSFKNLDHQNCVFGQLDFADQGRAKIMGENHGLLRIYAAKKDGLLLGAEMMAPSAEHLAHLLALAIEAKMTVFDILKTPFYHPTVEEGLRTALRDLAVNVVRESQDETLFW